MTPSQKSESAPDGGTDRVHTRDALRQDWLNKCDELESAWLRLSSESELQRLDAKCKEAYYVMSKSHCYGSPAPWQKVD